MDTDGSISAAGQAIYSTSLPSLRDDVVELVSSLGLKASISERRAIFEGRDYGPHWVIQFWPFSEIPVFRLERKRKLLRQRAAKASPRSRTRQIVAVRPVPSVPVQCISVESATKQYLVTRSLIPTHNTSTAAAIMVEALIINDRPEAEFVLVSSTKDLAGRAFKQGKAIIKVDPELDKIFQCQDHLKTITHRRSGAVLQVKAADTDVITGGKQVGTLIDELHVLSERSNASEIMLELRGALTARPDGFVIIITTQSKKPPSGAFKAELLKARAVRDGQLDLPLLPILYELPERLARDNGWMARRYWSLVNPNFGLSVDPTFLERELAAAEDEGKEAMALFASQFFNVEIGVGLHTDRWPGAEYWEAQTDPALTLDALIERCDLVVGGVDGGGLDDLLGICLLGREKDTGRWLIWCHAWAHVIVKERRKSIAARLGDFEKCGDLTFVTSMKQAHEEAADAFEQIDAIGLLGPIGFDPAGASGVEKALAARGIEGDERIRGVRQGYTLSGAVKDAETALSDGDLIHAAQPLLAWCVSNAKIEQTKNGYIVTKQASGWAKIDPLMAMFNAVHLMRDNPESASCYSASRGLVTFA
nr:terminase large subunit [Methylovirgula sp. HY1]